MENEYLTLPELLVLSSLQLVICKSNGVLSSPTEVGKAFFLEYKDNVFLVTAGHNIHGDNKEQVRQGLDNQVAIVTNRCRVNANGKREAELFSVGGFYSFEQYECMSHSEDSILVDVAFSILDKDKFKDLVCITEGVQDPKTGEIVVERGRIKTSLSASHLAKANVNDKYFIAGSVQSRWGENEFGEVVLESKYACHSRLDYDCCKDGFIYLKSPEIVQNSFWQGLSGSPVLNQEGSLIGILCGGVVGSNVIQVFDIHYALSLMDSALVQEAK